MDLHRSISLGRSLPRSKLLSLHPRKAQVVLSKEEIDKVIAEAEAERRQQKLQKEEPRLTSSFLSVSREKHEFATRNHTESPRPTHYTPIYTAIRPRTRAVRYHTPAAKRLFPPEPPLCQRSSRDSQPTQSARKTMASSPKKERQAFDFQLPRPELRESPTKQDFLGVEERDSQVLSCNPKPPGVPFSVLSVRKELWKENPLPQYETSMTSISPRIGTNILRFEQLTPHKSLALSHVLLSPPAPSLGQLQRGWKAVMKKTTHLPTMQNLCPRDDSMYRALGMYTLNVPKKQPFTDPPRHFGEPMQEMPKMPLV